MAKRLIWINDEIDPDLVEEVERKIDKFSRKSTAPIQVLINSPGGNTTSSLAIYDLFRNSRAPIHTTVVGDASSAASIILLGGDRRRMLANSRVFIHNASMNISGEGIDHREIKRVLKIIEDRRERLLAVYQRHLKASRRKIVRWLDRETYFHADEALKLGFVHEIVKSEKGKPFPKKKKGKKKRKR